MNRDEAIFETIALSGRLTGRRRTPRQRQVEPLAMPAHPAESFSVQTVTMTGVKQRIDRTVIDRLQTILETPGFTAIDDVSMRQRMDFFRKTAEPSLETSVPGLRRLDLDTHHLRAGFVQQIDFVAMAVAEKIEIGGSTTVKTRLERFDHDQVLEDMTHERIATDLLRFLDIQQIDQQTGLDEIVLRRLDDALAEVLEVRRQLEDDKGRLQDRQPVLDRLAVDLKRRGAGREG